MYPPESAKAAFDFIKGRFDIMEPKGIQRIWFTLDKEHGYSLWSLLDIDEDSWDQVARGIDLKSKTSRLVVDFFAKNLNLKLEVDAVKRSCANGSRRSIAYYRVQGSVYGGKFPNLSPEYARVGANDKKSMNELCHAFSEKRWNRLGTAR